MEPGPVGSPVAECKAEYSKSSPCSGALGMHGLEKHYSIGKTGILPFWREEERKVHVSTATSGRLNWLGARNTGNTGNTLFKSSDAHKRILESLLTPLSVNNKSEVGTFALL